MPRKLWTKQDDSLLKKLYPDSRSFDIAKRMQRSLHSIYGRANILKLKKSKSFLDSPLSGWLIKGNTVGSKTHFKSGHKPWNTGTKGVMKANRGCFKRGNKPHNTKRDGIITIRKDSSGRKYKWIRISESKWEMLHVYRWENKNGPTPKGYILIFDDGDTMNVTLKNIRTISRQNHADETRQKPGFIAKTMAHVKGAKGKYDKELQKEYLKHPELINAKRELINLNKQINHAQENRKA